MRVFRIYSELTTLFYGPVWPWGLRLQHSRSSRTRYGTHSMPQTRRTDRRHRPRRSRNTGRKIARVKRELCSAYGTYVWPLHHPSVIRKSFTVLTSISTRGPSSASSESLVRERRNRRWLS